MPHRELECAFGGVFACNEFWVVMAAAAVPMVAILLLVSVLRR